MKTLEFRQIMQFAEVQRASNSRTGIRAIPLIPNHEVMRKETEDDKHFNKLRETGMCNTCHNQRGLLATTG